MSKFNKNKEKVVPTTVNEMGERAYKLSAKEELVSTILTTFLTNSYYEKEGTITNRILECASKCDPLFVAKAAIYARDDAHMRSVTHLLSGYLAKNVSGLEWATRFYKRIIMRVDDMSEILAYIKYRDSNLKIPNPMKRAFRANLEALDPYLIDKYKMKAKQFSLKDLVMLFHPTPTVKNKEAYNRLMSGKSLTDLYNTRILEKTMSEAGKIAKDIGSSSNEMKGEAIREALHTEKGLPMMNLLRNLRNIIELSSTEVDEAVRQLTNKDKVLNSRLLPFRFATAYSEIEKLNISSKRAITFEKDTNPSTLVNKVLNGLEIALGYSVENIKKLVGTTAILIDHSGSVRGDASGSSKVSAFSKTTTAMIGNLFGSMLAYSQDNVYIGLFGDRLIDVPINRSVGVLKYCLASFGEGERCGGGTENGLYIFLQKCILEKIRVDNLVIFSDMVIGSGGIGGWDGSSRVGLGTFQELFKKFKAINPQCATISVNIKDTRGKSVFDKSLNVTQVSGWSDKIFDIVGSAGKGYEELIKEIESIKI